MSKTLHVFWLCLVLLWGTVGRPVQAAERAEKRAPIAACSDSVQEGFIRLAEQHDRYTMQSLIAYLEYLPEKKWLLGDFFSHVPQACDRLRGELQVREYWKAAFWAQDLTPLVNQVRADWQKQDIEYALIAPSISDFVWGKGDQLAKACMRRHFTTTEIPDSYLFDMLTQDELPFFRYYKLIVTPRDFGRLLSFMLQTFHLGLNAPICFQENGKEQKMNPLLFLSREDMPMPSYAKRFSISKQKYYYEAIRAYCSVKFYPRREQKLLDEIIAGYDDLYLCDGVTRFPLVLEKIIFEFCRGMPLDLKVTDNKGKTPLERLKSINNSSKIKKVIDYLEKQVNPPSYYERMISLLKTYKKDLFIFTVSFACMFLYLLLFLFLVLRSAPKKPTQHKKATISPQKVAGRSSAKGKLSQERGPSSARAKKNGEPRS